MRTIVALYILLIVVAAIMAVITALSLKSQPSATPQPENPFQNGQVENIAFTLYYPSKLPDGLHFDPLSASNTDPKIISIRITDGRGSATERSFSISQQLLPTGYDITAIDGSLSNKVTIKTGFGDAAIGTIDAGQSKFATLVTTDKTLVLIQAERGVSNEDLTQTLQSLKPAK